MTTSMRLDRNWLKHAAAVADAAVRSGTHPSAVIAVADSRDVVWTHVVSGEDRVDLDTIFLLASISKPITATAIMQLVERGQLLLDVPVASYLPEFGTEGGRGQITTWHLLTHTSGLNEQKWANARFVGQGAAGPCFEEACAAPLNFAPGERCEYCTLSFAVLSELITRIGGQPYPDYLRDTVFAPLGMRDTSFRPERMDRAAPVHGFDPPGMLEAFISRAIAGGGLWSTAGDLIRFGQALLRGGTLDGARLLGPAAIDTMTRLHTGHLEQILDGRPAPFAYGLGWGKPSPESGRLSSEASYGHGGATGTLLHVDPDYDLVCVFLTNRWGLENETARRALNAVYGAYQQA